MNDAAIPAWMARRELVALEHFEARDGSDAFAVADGAGRCLAICAPDFPPGHRLAPVLETDELAALFDQPPDQWFAPRVRGLVIGTVYAIRRGWPTAREGLAAMDMVLEGRGFLSRAALRFLRVLSWDMRSLLQGQSRLHEARAAFADVVGQGRPVDETPRLLPRGDHSSGGRQRDQTQLAATSRCQRHALFTLVQAMTDIVVARVYDAGEPAPVVRARLAPFETGRIGLIDACERARKKIQSEKPLEIKESS